MVCPNCGHPDAECIVNNYWKCPRPRCANNEEMHKPKKPRADTEPGWAQMELDFSDCNVPIMASYFCTQCGVDDDYDIDYVAYGGRCRKDTVPGIQCGGTLRMSMRKP